MTIKAVVFDAYGTLYDVQSVAAITDEAFPGYGEIITQIWRLKQLLYPDTMATLAAIKDRKLAILSNGSTDMLNSLVGNTGLDRILDATISVDSKKIFKPAPDTYTLIESNLGVAPADVLFVSSNPFDACGAKAFGLKVAWIERVTRGAMAMACQKSDLIAPLTMFRALRMQMDELGLEPDYRINGLSALVEILSSMPS